MMNDFPGDPIAAVRKTGGEPIVDEAGEARSTLLRFWRWAYSHTLDNALRGVLAEYLVGLAVDGFITETRLEWDLQTPEGITVEVKSAVVEAGTVLEDIQETLGWTAATNEYSAVAARQADVYVFCVFTARDRNTADPLDGGQWRFLVASTEHLNRIVGAQKTTLISRVAPEEVTFSGLADAVRGVAGR